MDINKRNNMKTILLALVVIASCAACTNENDTRRTLDAMGFTHIQTGGYDWLACGDDYTYHTHFTAINPAGKQIEGTVCCGIMKGCTPKF